MKTKTLLKFYKNSCGPCGMMSRYDFKVAEEEGVNFLKVQVNGPDYEKWKSVLWQLYPNGRGVGWPDARLLKPSKSIQISARALVSPMSLFSGK